MAAQRVLVVDDNQSFCNQLLAAFASAGYDASGCAHGGEALPLAEHLRPDLIVVDLVRPASSGPWLLEQLGQRSAVAGRSAALASPVLALVPVVGNYDDLPEGVEVQVKPIIPGQVVASAQRLLSSQPVVISHSVAATGASQDPQDLASAPLHLQIDEFDEDSDFGPADTLLGPRPTTYDSGPDSPADLAQALAAAQLRELSEEISCEISTEDAKLSAGSLQTPGAAPPLSASDANRAALSGDLTTVPLLEVIALLARQQSTGVLTVTAPGRLIEVVWRDGHIEQATATGFAGLRMGRFVLELELLGPAVLEEVANTPSADAIAALRSGSGALMTGSGADSSSGAHAPHGGQTPAEVLLLGRKLCQAGHLQPHELQQVLSRQTAELLFESLRLKAGRFVFSTERELPRRAIAPEYGAALHLDAEALLLEGHRRLADWQSVDRDAQDGAVYVSTGSAEGAGERCGLSEPEQLVLGLCSGRLGLRDIAKESRLPLLEVSRVLQRLQLLRLCRRRLPAVQAC